MPDMFPSGIGRDLHDGFQISGLSEEQARKQTALTIEHSLALGRCEVEA